MSYRPKRSIFGRVRYVPWMATARAEPIFYVRASCSHAPDYVASTQGGHLPYCVIEHRCYGCGAVWRTCFAGQTEGYVPMPCKPPPGTRLVEAGSASAPWRDYSR